MRGTMVVLLLAMGAMGCGVEVEGEASDVANEPEVAESQEQPIVFDGCACLNLGQLVDCRSGVCYAYCRGRYDDTYRCAATGQTFSCPSWYRYQRGTRVPNICLG